MDGRCARRRRARRSNRASASCPTAFSCRFGNGPLHLAICAEYDALPGIGHACGHNIIAATAVGAGLALAPLVDELGLTVTVIGTPAEEGGGGKVLLLERGAFDGVHAAMMVHPAPLEDMTPRVSAVSHFAVRYTGHESHAAAAPERGINAGDAFTVAQVAIGLLRQHLRAGEQVHGVVRHGGDAANIIPAHTEGLWMARARTDVELARAPAARAPLLRGGRARNGRHARHRTRRARLRADGTRHRTRRACTARNAHDLGRPDPIDELITFSTDMGNVSLAMPSIHPCIGIETRRRRQPPARVRGGVHQRVGRPRGARRIARDGVDRDRHRERSTPRRGSSARRALGPGSGGVPTTTTQSAASLPGGAGLGERLHGRARRRRRSRVRQLPGRGRPCTSRRCRPAAWPGPVARLELVRVLRELEVVGHLAGRALRRAAVQHEHRELGRRLRRHRVRRSSRSSRPSCRPRLRSWSSSCSVARSRNCSSPWFVSPSSTTLSSTTPMITASAMRPAPFAAAKLAPRAPTVFPLPRPPGLPTHAVILPRPSARCSYREPGSARRPSSRTRRRWSRCRRSRFTVSGS